MLNIDTNAKKIAQLLDTVRSDQLPFARSLIANRMAQEVKRKEVQVMKNRLDRPTPFSLNSLQLKPGNKAKPEARVWFKDYASKGTPADKYLRPQAFGGERSQKRFERAMIARGYLSSGQYLVPASGAILDAYGNVKRSQVTQIMSALRAFGEQGYTSNATGSARSKRAQAKSGANRYFFGTVDGQAGVWQRVKSGFGEGVKPVFLVTDGSPKYRVRFPFFKIAENVLTANYERVARDAIADVLASQRAR